MAAFSTRARDPIWSTCFSPVASCSRMGRFRRRSRSHAAERRPNLNGHTKTTGPWRFSHSAIREDVVSFRADCGRIRTPNRVNRVLASIRALRPTAVVAASSGNHAQAVAAAAATAHIPCTVVMSLGASPLKRSRTIALGATVIDVAGGMPERIDAAANLDHSCRGLRSREATRRWCVGRSESRSVARGSSCGPVRMRLG